MGLLGYKLGNAVAARRSRFARPAQAFIAQPEPRTIGVPARGQQMMNGFFLFAGHVIEAPNTSIWDLDMPSDVFEQELHGFSWLDHLAADGSTQARTLAKQWLWEWIARFGNGTGVGWTPQLTGRRIVRVINHALFLLAQESGDNQKAYFKTLGQQADFLAKRWSNEYAGLPRFEALTGLIYCGLALEGKKRFLKPAMKNLAKQSVAYVDQNGAIPSRNPEELMDIFTTLAWAAHAIGEAEEKPLRDHLLAMERIVPSLRALRLGDGGLIHFHGGGRGMEGRLDQSLSDASIRLPATVGGAMGYHRMANSGSVLIMDGGTQPAKDGASFSALSFELSIGRQPLIVNMGPGRLFGGEWWDTSKLLMAHSGLCVDQSSPVIDTGKKAVPVMPTVSRSENTDFDMVASSHSGFVPTYGLTHYRSLEMSRDGMTIRGKDVVAAETDADQLAFRKWMKQNRKKGIPFDVRFHIAPDVQVELGMRDTAATLTTPKGEMWILRAPNTVMTIQQSAYMQYGRLKPRATNQVVVSGGAINYEGVIEWSLTRLEA
jgi:uncharacterized heparinase superfamily protein